MAVTLDEWVSSSQTSPVIGDSASLDDWVTSSQSSPAIFEADAPITSLKPMQFQVC